jgi:hypothetical protein
MVLRTHESAENNWPSSWYDQKKKIRQNMDAHDNMINMLRK